jgi:stage II sporulation protein AA (anti-sigma F factor antagonist)
MKIAASFSSGKLTVFLSGELDHHEAGGAIRAIDRLIEEHMPRECAIDMSGLSFMDSSGIAVVINASRKMRSFGGRLSVENPAEQAGKVLEASGIDRLIAVATKS